MPEGDTIVRTAATLHRWLAGREITAAAAGDDVELPARLLVGRRVDSVDAWGKHLMVRLDDGVVVHTHLRMIGSWHVYRAGEAWRRPSRQARLTLTCGDRVAVCFNAPVVELLRPGTEPWHPALGTLGPDVLAELLDLEGIRRRARAGPPDRPLGELLLDQRVVAGIGNIWRCEGLFLEGLDPWAPLSALDDAQLDRLVAGVADLMRTSATARSGVPGPRWVHRRAGRPCRRCGSPIRSRRQGEHARTTYWCPACQPPVPVR